MNTEVPVNKILFITLSNIGDVILTLPVLDVLRERFPQGEITVLVGPRPKEIFQGNPHINRLIVYDKNSRLKEKIRLFNELKKENFEMIIDLRNSIFGALIPARYKTSPFLITPKNITHMKDRHLYKVTRQASGVTSERLLSKEKSLHIKHEDEKYIEDILKKSNISQQDKIIVVSSGARSHIKRWPRDKFVELISTLIKEFGAKIILVGDKDDVPTNKYVTENLRYSLTDLTGKTNVSQLTCLLRKASCIITNDSAVLHLASYLNISIVAIFGPTNELKYGPWSDIHSIVKKDIFCRPCEKAQCRFRTLECMQLIKVEDVLRQVRNILLKTQELKNLRTQELKFKRILIVRTDRIGDVLLSTPVIKALRDNYPHAFIAMMVGPYAKDIVHGNPYLDEVIIYDKNIQHKSWVSSIRFALTLKNKRFDLGLILHPTNRVHLLTFFAGIPRRVGYDRKLGFLLTDRIKHTKQFGEKHELEYNLDLVRYLGIQPKDKEPFMPIRPESEKWAEELFRKEMLKEKDKLLAIHPGASCPSKIWPLMRFAEVADRLVEKYGFKVLIIAGPKDMAKAGVVMQNLHNPAINLAGKTSVSQLASLLKKCKLFISNDSGPVHIASSVGTPVISIFGRNQKGLSPIRWGPVGKRDRILHKEVGCIKCLAHNCIKDFICLKAITVDDVLNTVDLILSL